MRLYFLLRLALTNVFSNKLRAGLTVGGIGLSVGVMLFLLGVGNGLQHLVTTELSQTDSQRVVTVSSKRSKQLKLNQETIAKLKSISGVSQVEQTVGLSGRVTYHGISLDLPVYAVTPGYFDVTPLPLKTGALFSGVQEQDRRMVMSDAAVKALGIAVPKDGLNKQMQLQVSITNDLATAQTETTRQVGSPAYLLTGIIDKGNVPVAYIPTAWVFEQGVNVASEAKVIVTSPDKITPVRETVEQMGFQTSSIRDTIDQVNQIFEVIRTILIVFGVITLVVAVFGTLNTITIALVEQTPQVGFLRMIGIQRRDVGKLFLVQSVILSVCGVLAGVGLGLLLGGATNVVVEYLARGTDVQGLSLYEVPVLAIVVMLVLAVGLGWIIGLGPSRRAVNLRPLEALRM